MATQAFGQDFNALTRVSGDRYANVGAQIRATLVSLSPSQRRFALTGLGALLSLSLGAATASAFRLPAEITDPAQPQDQVLAQSELPSEAAARAYALENPPTLAVASKADDAVPVVAAEPVVQPDLTAVHDEPLPAVTYTSSSSDDQPAAAVAHDEPTPAPTSAPTAADPTGANP